MMSSVTATERQTKRAGETVPMSCNYIPKLDSGELLTGTPTVTVSPVTVPPLTVSSVSKTTAIKTISGRTVGINQGVQWLAAAGLAGTEYTLTVKCNTDQGGVNREVECILIVD